MVLILPYQAREMSPCCLIQVCIAMPAATAALTLRVEPNWAIDTVSAAPALRVVGDAGALLPEDQQAVLGQGVSSRRSAPGTLSTATTASPSSAANASSSAVVSWWRSRW